MSDGYKKRFEFSKDTLCSVSECAETPFVEVILYDYYDFAKETFYQQHYICPFLCEKHMNINEEKAVGERMPRGIVQYPYSNKDGAQGFSKYMPLKDLYPKLFSSEELENSSELQISLKEVTEELIVPHHCKAPNHYRQF